jgi:preprotein translocase subunit SecD
MKKNLLLLCFVISIISCASNQNKDISDEITAKNLEKGNLSFYIIDKEITQYFNNYYNENPNSTFNEKGELLNPKIIPSDVFILPFLDINVQRRNENNPEYGTVRQKTNEARQEKWQNEYLIGTIDDESGEMNIVLLDTSFKMRNYKYLAINNRSINYNIKNIGDIKIEKNPLDKNKPFVTFSLEDEEREIFYKLTSANVGMPLAIVNGNIVRTIVIIDEPINGKVLIESISIEDANNVALLLRNTLLVK